MGDMITLEAFDLMVNMPSPPSRRGAGGNGQDGSLLLNSTVDKRETQQKPLPHRSFASGEAASTPMPTKTADGSQTHCHTVVFQAAGGASAPSPTGTALADQPRRQPLFG